MFRRTISALSFLLLANCAYNSPASQVAPGSEVGGTGDIQFDHQELSGRMHLLTVSARPGLAETETSLSQRNYIFQTSSRLKPVRRDLNLLITQNRIGQLRLALHNGPKPTIFAVAKSGVHGWPRAEFVGIAR